MKFRYISGFIILLILTFIYYRFNPEMYHFFPECPLHQYLGLDCPGCGSQRAIHALLHGDILKAADHNLLLVISLPFFMIHYSLHTYSILKRQDHRWKIWQNPLTPKIIFALVMAFWILRNLPFAPFTYLAA